MNKIIALLLSAVILAVTLTACGNNAEVKQEQTTSTASATAKTEDSAPTSASAKTESVEENQYGIFPNIVYEDYGMVVQEADELYFKPASDDYIVVVNGKGAYSDIEECTFWQNTYLLSFDENGALIQYDVRETYNWEHTSNIDEVIERCDGKLVGDSMYYHDGYYDDGYNIWGQKLLVLTDINNGAIGGGALDNLNGIYYSSPLTSEQTAGDYKNTLSEEDFTILSFHTPASDDYTLLKDEIISVEALDSYVTGGYTVHKNDAFSYHTESLKAYDELGACIQYEIIIVCPSNHDAEQYMLYNNGYLEKQPKLVVKYDVPDNMELRDNVWLYTFYVDDTGTETDLTAEVVSKWIFGKKSENEFWSKPFLTESQLKEALKK